MKRILYIITNADLGGAQSHLIDLVTGFKDRYRIDVVSGDEGPMTEQFGKIGIPVYVLPSLARSINPLLDIVALVQLQRLINELKPHLIHAHSSKAGLIARFAALLTRIPCVFTAHGWGFAPGAPVYQRILVWISEAVVTPISAKVICVSDYDHKLALVSLPGKRERFVHISNGLPDCAKDAAAVDGSPVFIIMVARFNEQKDQPLLLRAFAKLDCDAKLQFVGSGLTLDACKALVVELGIAERVEFLGDRLDVPSLLSRAQIFALISRYEGMPISILEAMRAGLPVIATRVGGVPEQVEHGIGGYLVPPADVEALTLALKLLVTNPTLRVMMGDAGQRKFQGNYTLETMLLKTAVVYESILR